MALSDDAIIIAMARDANPEHDLTAMLPFLSRFAALVAAREREKCAVWHSKEGWLLDEDDVPDAMRARKG